MTWNRKDQKEAKRKAVVERLKDISQQGSLDMLSGLWGEQTLDALILALGLGHVEID